MTARAMLITILVAAIAFTASGATPAQRRIGAAAELQRTFDGSILKGWELKFVVRGKNCDALHVEGYTNLETSMMEALGYGTLIYGRVLPGGVNNFAFGRGFRDVVYTNSEGSKYRAFGSSNLTRKQVKAMRKCTDAIAAKLSDAVAPSPPKPAAPAFEQLSWQTAQAGTKLYDGTYRHDATIASVDRAAGMIYVKYVRTGTTEPKLLDSVARFWYVKK